MVNQLNFGLLTILIYHLKFITILVVLYFQQILIMMILHLNVQIHIV